VPAGFVAEAFAAVGARDLWVLGSAPCRTGRCTVVVRTRDGGRTFARAGTLPLPTEGTTPSLAFADDRNGFAFVPGFDGVLYATHDGGKSWHRQALGDVLAFAATESTAYAVTARCAPDGCTRYRLVHAPASSSAWSATATPFTPDGGLVALAARGSKLWLLGSLVGIHPKDRLARSGDSGRTFTTASGPCYSDLGGTLTPAPASVVWAVCPTGMLGAAFRSIDGGASFTQLKTEALANSARLAAASGTTAVLFGNGAGSRLMRTTDGGASWKPARTPRIPSDVWSLAFTSSRVGFALVQTGWDAKKKVERQMLWRTTDAGARWSELQIR
jgi:photosystem II stability/assembly factor-like uncharacterized protein